MLTVTLVATFASAAMWQQWRAVEVETAERARIQSAWILVGALDWSRLILREDSLARGGDGTDNLTEPWSVPLEEARLSTFLAAQRGVSQVEDASTDTADAFLSGQVTDLQSRLNLRNLASTGQVNPVALRQFTRLFEYLGLPMQELALLSQGMAQAQVQRNTSTGSGNTGTGTNAGGATANVSASTNANAPLLPQTVSQLTWWGLSPASAAALAPYATLLPVPTKVNVNTASAVVLWASVDQLDMSDAQRLVQAREGTHFKTENDAAKLIGSNAELTAATHSVSSSYFEVRGRLRLGTAVVEERSLVLKQRGSVRTLWRERGSFVRDSADALR
ncbi:MULTISPECIES: type II secretion system minor pseudopilin GspK [unclassified Acidovorax]|uniref:type II secretion system minor pseudopilin GspK n=1 Tax=unclassified Acidovorax TaxID=2684926 RepID=UPI003857CA69